MTFTVGIRIEVYRHTPNIVVTHGQAILHAIFLGASIDGLSGRDSIATNSELFSVDTAHHLTTRERSLCRRGRSG